MPSWRASSSPLRSNDRPVGQCFGAMTADDVEVGAIRDKADVLAVGLVGHQQAELGGQRAGF